MDVVSFLDWFKLVRFCQRCDHCYGGHMSIVSELQNAHGEAFIHRLTLCF